MDRNVRAKGRYRGGGTASAHRFHRSSPPREHPKDGWKFEQGQTTKNPILSIGPSDAGGEAKCQHPHSSKGIKSTPTGRSPDFWLLSITLKSSQPQRASDPVQHRMKVISPVTVAGPRRIFTGFPFQPRMGPPKGSSRLLRRPSKRGGYPFNSLPTDNPYVTAPGPRRQQLS